MCIRKLYKPIISHVKNKHDLSKLKIDFDKKIGECMLLSYYNMKKNEKYETVDFEPNHLSNKNNIGTFAKRNKYKKSNIKYEDQWEPRDF